MKVTDADSPYNNNDKSTYVIETGNESGVFDINSTTGEITMTRQVRYNDTVGYSGK